MNSSAYYLDEIVETTLAGLKEQLGQTEALAEMIKGYNSERTRLAGKTVEQTRIVDKQIAELKQLETRLWADYDKGVFDGDLASVRLLGIRNEIGGLEERKRALPSLPETVVLHPSSVKKFADCVDTMARMYAIQITDENREAAEAIRKLVDAIVITPQDFGTHIEIKGLIGMLVEVANRTSHAPKLGGVVVAGEGLEPPTRGL